MYAQEVSKLIISRVYKIRKQNAPDFGSSFTIDVDNKQYLITARHVLLGIKDDDSIEIEQNNVWKPYKVKVIEVLPAQVDIIVIALPVQITFLEPIDVSSSSHFFISQNAYFLGFPLGMKADGTSINDGFPIPLVKRGMFSAVVKSPQGFGVIYLDGYNNKGFSGGPIVYTNSETRQLSIAGVVSSYIWSPEDIYSKTDLQTKPRNQWQDTGIVAAINSGIVQGHSIQPAIEAIKKNLIGPTLAK